MLQADWGLLSLCIFCGWNSGQGHASPRMLMAQDHLFIIPAWGCTSSRAPFGWGFGSLHQLPDTISGLYHELDSSILIFLSLVQASHPCLWLSSLGLLLFPLLATDIDSNGILLYSPISVSACQKPQSYSEADACMVIDKHVSKIEFLVARVITRPGLWKKVLFFFWYGVSIVIMVHGTIPICLLNKKYLWWHVIITIDYERSQLLLSESTVYHSRLSCCTYFNSLSLSLMSVCFNTRPMRDFRNHSLEDLWST